MSADGVDPTTRMVLNTSVVDLLELLRNILQVFDCGHVRLLRPPIVANGIEPA